MNKIAIAFLAATSLASFGCKKKGGAEAMEMMKTYKTAICACKDHDTACGTKATDAYQKAQADWVAKNPSDKAADTSAKPDPEQEKLTAELAECSKRVMTPDAAAGGAGGAAAAAPAAGGADTAAGGAAAPAAAGSDTAAPAGGAAPAAGDTAGSGSAAK
jgi:hypothetical protein